MPDDLLHHVLGPSSPWAGWAWLAALLVVLLGVWYVALFAWTAPRRDTPNVVQRVQAVVLRRRFGAAVRRVDHRFQVGEIDRSAAAAELSRLLRDFLHEATGQRAQFLRTSEIASGELAAAAPLLRRLDDVQFNPAADEDGTALGGATEELIRSWT